MTHKISIEVAYAAIDEQRIVSVNVSEACTVYEAAELSGIKTIFPEIDLEQAHMGIFGKVVKKPKDQVLRDGDRIEIYRPLTIDPKQARLNRAAKTS